MSNYSRIALAVVFCLCFVIPASAAVITVDTSIPQDTDNAWDLAEAISKAALLPSPPHEIMIMAGSYGDANLTHNPTYVSQIYGDPAGEPADVVFTAPAGTDDFLTVGNDLTIKNMTIIGYDEAFKGNTVANAILEDLVIQGASGYGIHGTTWAFTTVNDCVFDGLNLAIDLTACTNGSFNALTFTGGNYGLVLRAGSWPNVVTGCMLDGLNNDGIWLHDANVTASGNLIINCGGYAVYKWGSAGYTLTDIHDNCFLDNNGGGVQAYNVQPGLSPGFAHNYYSDNIVPPGTSYAIAGGTSTDGNAWINENNPIGPATVDVGAALHIDIDWTIPGCAELDEVILAAYNFTVTWAPAAALTFVAADHSKTYFGENGSIYTLVDVDEIAGTAVFAATGFEEPGMGTGTLAFLDFTATQTGTVNITVSSEYLDEEGNPIPGGSTGLAVDVEDNVSPTCEIVPNDPITGTNTYSNTVPLIIEGHVTDNYDLRYAYYRVVGEYSWKHIGAVDGLEDDYGPTPVDLSTVPHGTGYELEILVYDDSYNECYSSYFFDVDKVGPVVTAFTLSDDDCPVTAGYTNQVSVTANITATGDPVEMDFKVDGAWGVPPYMAFDDDGSVDITGGTPSDGATYEVRVRLFDIYGNQGGVAIDNIIYDESPATLSGYGLTESLTNLLTTTGDATWGSQTVNIAWYVTGDPAASEGDVLLDCDYVGWVAAAHNFTVDLPGEGTWYVWFNTMERAGNMQTPVVASIVVDQTAPVITDFQLLDQEGEDCSEKLMVDWYIAWTEDPVTFETTKDDPMDPGASWYDHASFDELINPWTCSHAFGDAGDGDYVRYARLTDAAGNVSVVEPASIEVDRADPTLASLIVTDRTATDAPIYDKYSNEKIVNLDMTGLSSDVVSLVITEDNWTTSVTVPITPTDPLTYEYPYDDTPADCPGKNYIKVKSMDCAGRMSVERSNYFRFDDELPTVDAFSGPPITNTFIGVPLTLAASDDCNVWKMRFSEDPAFAGVMWDTYNTSKSFDLDPGPGDVPRTIYVQVSDWAGNISLTDDISIDVDTQAPAGLTMNVKQDPLGPSFAGALDGYTNSATENEIIGITADPDATEMWIYTPGSGCTNTWTTMASEFRPLIIDGTADGTKMVYMKFKDGAGNVGDWMTQVIELDTDPPPAPGSASSTPGQSMDISWSTVGVAQSYILGYVRSLEYPTYTSGAPLHAMTMGGATIFDEVVAPETTCEFDYVEQDVFAVSIWTKDEAGNTSTTPNTQVIGTNYILGDFYDSEGEVLGHDGWIDKEWEVVDLLLAYGSVDGGLHWNALLDIHPTHDATRFGYPTPDLDIDFWDLAFFGLNYRDYRLGMIRSGGLVGKVAPFAGAVTMTAEVPTPISEGGMYSVSVKVDNAWALAGYHVTLDFNRDDFELVSVQPGAIYEKSGEHFFFTEKSSLIDVASVPFTEQYDGEEIFTVQLKSKTGAEIELTDVEMIFVNEEVAELPVTFTTVTVAKTGLIPNAFTLSQNYPNPFNPATTIQFGVPTATDYKLTIYNVLGQVVETFEGYADAGWVNIRWDAADQATGIYLYRVTAGEFQQTRKMVLIK